MGPQPHETIWGLATATVASRTLHVVAELGVADLIDDSPAGIEDLAIACGADRDGLDRALQLLAAHGVFARRAPGTYAHTDASRLLRSDHPMGMRAFPRMMGLASFTASFAELAHSIRTGSPAFDLVDREGLFAHLERNPEAAKVFDESMTAKAAADIGAVLAAFDFTRFRTIADVGGGRGHLLRAVLESAPASEGILFDLPAVVETIGEQPARLSLHAGDFFIDPLPHADAYVLMEVIHDWDDERAAAILAAVRRAGGPDATVLIIEAIADDERLDPVVRTLDMIMLAITGGRERTSAHLARLLAEAGFATSATIGTRGPLRIVEAVAGRGD